MAMTRSMRQLARRKLDEKMSSFWASPLRAPTGGWVRAIREALGMPRRELARRMGVGEQRVVQLEQGEAHGKVTLAALRRAASALDCELVVALVPRRPMEETVTERRKQLAGEWLKTNTLHTMAMENQAVAVDDLPPRLLREIEDRFPDERLWDEP